MPQVGDEQFRNVHRREVPAAFGFRAVHEVVRALGERPNRLKSLGKRATPVETVFSLLAVPRAAGVLVVHPAG
jgi:hypothetical protein